MWSRIAKLFIGNLLVIIVLLGLCEIVLRIYGKKPYSVSHNKLDIEVTPGGRYFEKDSLLGYRHKAGEFNIMLKGTYKFTTQHNTATNRVTSLKNNGEKNEKPEIWIFGCSFTHGWSINDNETFPWILQSQLSDFKIVNWGVSGYGTLQFFLQLKRALKNRTKTQPVLVIFNHANFHFQRNTYSFERRRTRSRISRWNSCGILNQPFAELDENGALHTYHKDIKYKPSKLFEYSVLAYLLKKGIENYIDGKNKAEEMKISRLIYDEILLLCQKRQVSVLLTNIGNNPKFIREYSLKNNIPFLDIFVDLKENGNTNSPYDSHPSAKANIVYANRLYAYLNDFLRIE